jgi:alkylation response protein AidB-like acyl-CoA dehydrogenase
VDLNDTPEQAEYRAKVRSWIEANKDGAPGLGGADAGKEEAWIAERRDWQRKLAEGGFAGVTWPAEFGGQGLGPLNQVIITQELQAAGVPGILDVIGIGMLGPTVIAHGTDEQKQRYLAPMLAADEVWCQMFSEPAAGSDLAGIQTKAEVQPDGSWKLNGQKVWTTNAHFASYGLILARTNPDVPKHKGMSMFIVPMDAEGVTIRPLRQITGEAEFNEVFFDDCVIPADAVVGPVDGGWTVALTTLLFERLAIGAGSEGFGYRADRFAEAIASDPVASADHDVRHRLGKLATDLLALRYTGFRHLTAIERGGLPGSEAALGKVTAVKAAIAAGDLIADVVGPDALAEGEWAYLISFLPGLKSAGGTEEILRNMVGERVLGLPTEPRLDKGIPFNELRALEKEGASA